jgi:hypothetical protein
MGLTIYYTLRTDAPFQDAPRLLRPLHERAIALGFLGVGEIYTFRGDDVHADQTTRDDPLWWLKIRTHVGIETEHGSYSTIEPLAAAAFMCAPGDCEPSPMGLCSYPSTVTQTVEEKTTEMPTRFGNALYWQSFCKTQYASNPARGGMKHFLEAHTRLVDLLDFANDLGLLHEVADHSGFWVDRDLDKLAKTVQSWNQLVAGFVGALGDAVPKGVSQSSYAPIKSFPNYEHLEAKGRHVAGRDNSLGEVD